MCAASLCRTPLLVVTPVICKRADMRPNPGAAHADLDGCSSGTSQLAAGLQALGLEVEHEHSDSRWAFCRDGTVSWFHGTRFLPGKPREESLRRVCSKWWDNIGYSVSPQRLFPLARARSRCLSPRCAMVVNDA